MKFNVGDGATSTNKHVAPSRGRSENVTSQLWCVFSYRRLNNDDPQSTFEIAREFCWVLLSLTQT